METLSIVIFMCLLILNNSIARSTETPSTENSLIVNNTNSTTYCSRQGISCYDRFTIQHCDTIGTSGLRYTVSCKVQNPDRPYCMEYENRVQCIFTHQQTIAPEMCNKDGLRSDPLDCTRYVQCARKQNGNGFFGSIVNCPKGTIYDKDRTQCISIEDADKWGVKCDTIHSYCSRNEGKLVAFPQDESIYVKCPAQISYSVNSNDEFIVNVCDHGSTFNQEIGSCEKSCQSLGNIPDYGNCNAYFTCFLFNKKTSNICPTGTGFNRRTRLCDENNANCTNNI